MDVFNLRDSVINEYGDYIRSFIEISDTRVKELVKSEIEGGHLWPAPLVQLSPSFETGETLEQLIENDELHPECINIFREKSENGEIGNPFNLHKHQIDGIRAANADDSYVLTTGTGSGKSLAYIVPIVDHVLRRGSGKGIQAIVIYPMNALANSQLGELKKFLHYGFDKNSIPVTFKRYTGQESDQERKEIVASPPDILLTNYVMLELLLTRPWDHQLINAAQNLRFIVLDELHTYRGRQGADVSMLVRRLKNASNAKNVLCVGTSATLSGGNSWQQQKDEVSKVATQIFGIKIDPERVIGETLRRVTEDKDISDPKFIDLLRSRLKVEGIQKTGDLNIFLSDPLLIWLESSLGLTKENENDRLIRCEPRSLSGKDGVANELAQLTGIEQNLCEDKIREALLFSCSYKDNFNQPLFAFRLHQFVSKGDAVYASPENEDIRHITLQAQQFVPNSDRKKVLLPVTFCRECGQEYYVVRQSKNEKGYTNYIARSISDFIDDDDGIAGFLYISNNSPWPEDISDQIKRLPDNWLEADGQKIRNTQRKNLPQKIFISEMAEEDGGTQIAWWFKAPFKFCMNCGVTYNPRQRSDFGKLTTLGSEGRSTATSVISLSAIRNLYKDGSLEKQAQKLLSFTDNRQDASLQAGHFNDFVEVSIIRSSLWRALSKAGEVGISHDQLTSCVLEAMNLPIELYSIDENVKYKAREDTDRAFREVLGYYIYRDLQRGWRVTSPNLEQCGLLTIEYSSLYEFCNNSDEWEDCHEVLRTAEVEERQKVCRALLDFMRRELAIHVSYLRQKDQESILQLSNQRLKEPWSLEDDGKLEVSKVMFPHSRIDHIARQIKSVFLSPLGGFGLFLRQHTTFKTWNESSTNSKLKIADIAEIIPQLCEKLTIPGIILREENFKGEKNLFGYKINAASMVWFAGSGTIEYHDFIRIPRPPKDGQRTNPYFKNFYCSDFQDLSSIEAREHTAQVSSETREEREERFRSASLPILYCSPTMELGIDISQLNVVNMRNIPPTPANYAQRSGRAGRSGQPAFIISYCATGSPHDQYYFKRPQNMVSGSVSTPRLDLTNEDLIKSHIHAIWLECSGLSLETTLNEILIVEEGESPSLKLQPNISDTLGDISIQNRAFVKVQEALGDVIYELFDSKSSCDEWIRTILKRIPNSFDQACDRWRGLYMAALNQSNRQHKKSIDPTSSERDRKSAKRLRDEAAAQINLLLGKSDSIHSDFYSYRYFASEGFLPGYNFPRLPLTAFLPGQNRSKYSDEFLSRPRFLAINEFGPRSIIYHEGSRYIINKVILPVESDGSSGSIKRRATQCEKCGYLHPLMEESGPDICEHCNEKLPPAFNNLFRMLNVSTRRRDRISSDEEERLRLGYEIKTGIKFVKRNNKLSVKIAEIVSKEGSSLAKLHYGHGATIWRMNVGWRQRKEKGQIGYNLDIERGYWSKNKEIEDDPDDPQSERIEPVVPYVEDTKNCILLNFNEKLAIEAMSTLEASLKTAIQQYFQLEDREIASEALPDSKRRNYILFYEASEGGAGVLRHLVEDVNSFPSICKLALEIAHFNPETGEDLHRAVGSRENCEAACYDCLLSYFNQRDHQLLDRKLLPDLLKPLMDGTVNSSSTEISRSDQLIRLFNLCQSNLEKKWLELIDKFNLNIPSYAQKKIEECGVVPDFMYSNGVVIFVDGPHHDEPSRRSIDENQTELLKDMGLTVIRFHHDENWETKLRKYPSIFGEFSNEI